MSEVGTDDILTARIRKINSICLALVCRSTEIRRAAKLEEKDGRVPLRKLGNIIAISTGKELPEEEITRTGN